MTEMLLLDRLAQLSPLHRESVLRPLWQPADTAGRQLVAFVVPRDGASVDTSELLDFLRARLQHQVVPSHVVVRAVLPRSSSGKIDRRALERLPLHRVEATTQNAMGSPVEQILHGLWCEILQVERISRDEDFFRAGGHSLLATRLVTRVRRSLGVELTVRELFENPTIKEFAHCVERRRHADTADLPSLVRAPRECRLPLSMGQRRLWVLSHVDPAVAAYNCAMPFRLIGRVEVAALEHALTAIVERHEVLRTVFATDAGGPHQAVLPASPVLVPVMDLRPLPAPERDAACARMLYEQSRRSFDLSDAPLLRATLFRCGDDDYVFLLVVHHIACDGWSGAILARELSSLYAAARAGAAAVLPPLPVQYPDYAAWQQQLADAGVFERQIEYWTRQLADAPGYVDLPLDRARPAVRSGDGAMMRLELPAALVQRLAEVARHEGTTMFVALLAAFKVVLHRYSGQTDIIVGTDFAGRSRPEVEPLLGFFVNQLILRTPVRGSMTYRDVVRQLHQTALAAYDHADVPFDHVVERLRPERSPGINPLVQIDFTLHDFALAEVHLPGAAASPLPIDTGVSRFDLEVNLYPDGDRIVGSVQYDTDLFMAATLDRLFAHYVRVLETVAAAPACRVDDIDVLDGQERAQLAAWNATARRYATDRTVIELVADQAERTPDDVAVVDGTEVVTYAQIMWRATSIGAALAALGLGPNRLVALLADRSIAFLSTVLGVFAARAAYVPLDPRQPSARNAEILRESGAALLVVAPEFAGVAAVVAESVPGLRLARMETLERWARPLHRLERGRAVDLAYVMFTSGSTGVPKGAMVEQRGMINHLLAKIDALGLTADTRLAQTAAHWFDISVWQFLAPLLVGGQVHVIDDTTVRDPRVLQRTLEAGEITVAEVVPSLLRPMVDELSERRGVSFPALRWMIATGEALSPELARLWLRRCPHVPLLNAYGPTECSDDVTHAVIVDVPPLTQQRIPIGRPLPNLQIHVVDASGNQQPTGGIGEILVGGIGVGRGYLHDPAATAVAFVPDPFSEVPGARVYRTGDLGRVRADGEIEFVGRDDHQVKLRGWRIELGEIEAVVQQHPAIRDAVVMVREDAPGKQQLVAYVVARAGDQVDSSSAGWSAEHVSAWQEIFDDTYLTPVAGHDPSFIGWNSSYTGEPISADEMAEWRDRTVAAILEREPARVLEIGCGTGMLLTRIAPRTNCYWGTDFSPHVIAQLSEQLAASGHWPQVRLFTREAADFSDIPDGAFDCVVLNSVVQYFPDVHYLVRVLQGAVATLAPGGWIFIGDVRHRGLLRALHTSVELFNAADDIPAAVLRETIAQRLLRDEELVVDPAFFHHFRAQTPRVTGVSISLKRGSALNELTRARYQVILDVDCPRGAEAEVQVEWVPFTGEVEMIATLRSRLARGRAVGVRGVPNARIERDVVAADWLVTRQLLSVRELRAALAQIPEGVDPEVFWRLAEDVGAAAHVTWSDGEDGRYDVLLAPPGALPRVEVAVDTAAPWTAYCSNPLHGKFASRLAPQLRHFIADRLPEQMVPAAFILLDALPLTANGKINRRALPAPAVDRPDVGDDYVAPRTPIERRLVDIWAELLRVKRLGVCDNFFALGGHSLVAIQMISRIRAAFGVRLEVRTIFECQTIEAIAQRLEQTGEPESTAIQSHRPVRLPVELLRKTPDREYWDVAVYQLPEWYLHELAPESAFYNICLHLMLTGDLDSERLVRAWQMLIDRHGSLRMTFTTVEGRPVMRVAEGLSLALDDIYMDRRDVPEDRVHDEIQQILGEASAIAFDFERGPLFRVRLTEFTGRRYLLVFLVHHIIWDETSTMILWRELAECYNALRQQRPPRLPRLEFEYTDFAESVNRALTSGLLEQQRQYWLRLFVTVPDPLDLPADFPRPQIQSFRGDDLRHDLAPDLSQRLDMFARSQNSTLYIVLLAVLDLWIYKLTGREDFVIGSPIANRDDERIESMVGLFATALPMRATLRGDMTFDELLRHTRDVAVAAYDNHAYPSILAIQEIAPPIDASRNRLFSVMYGLQHQKTNLTVDVRLDGDVEISGLHDVVTADAKTAPFDLTLIVDYARDHIFIRWQYSTDLFRRETVAQFAQQFDTLLAQAVADPERRLDHYELLDAGTRAAVLDAAAGPVVPVTPATVHELFEAQARQRPQAVAVESRSVALTYEALFEAAARIAARLLELGIQQEDRVAVVMEPSPAATAAILGALKAGAAYVPISPQVPRERRRIVLDAAQARVVLVAADVGDVGEGRPLLRVGPAGEVESARQPDRWPCVDPDQLAYVIYTSGTTGTPKGIEIAHRGVVNVLAATEYVHPLYPDDAVLGLTPLSFDASIIDLFWPLAYGVRSVSVPSESAASPQAIAGLIEEHRITVWECVPTVLEGLVAARLAGRVVDLPSLRLVMCGGEPLRAELAGQFLECFPQARLANHYGPSEVTVDASAFAGVGAASEGYVPIGCPLANTRTYVLDERWSLVPPGVAGEIYVSSPGVARGYVADPAATAAAFLPDPFAAEPGRRMYRTGDRGVFDTIGRLHCLGRLDGQVKVQGNRVELGDVEAAVTSHPGVHRSAVVHRATSAGSNQLIAYVELRPELTDLVTLEGRAVRTFTLRQRPELQQQVHLLRTAAGFDGRDDIPGDQFGVLGVILVDAQDGVVGYAATLPVTWDGTAGELPASKDDALARAGSLPGGIQPDALLLIESVAIDDDLAGGLFAACERLARGLACQRGVSVPPWVGDAGGRVAPEAVRLDAAAGAAVWSPVHAEDVKGWVAERVPAYMIPSHVVIVGTMPMTSSNKIDRRSLTLIGAAAGPRGAPPGTDVQRRLHAIWQAVLKHGDFGVTSDFFALGGHSMLAAQLLALINSEFGTGITLRQLFTAPTIVGLERMLAVAAV